MSKSEMLHELYNRCKEIKFDESSDLIINAASNEEKEFVKIITDYFMQIKQKQVIEEKRF